MNQLHHGVPLRLVQLQPVGPLTTRDHQAVSLAHGIGIGDAQLPKRSPAAPGRCPPARRTHSPLRGGRSWPAHRGSRGALLRRQTAVALAGVAAEAEGLQVAEVVGAALVPPLRGRLRLRDVVVHLQGPLVLMGSAALAAALGASMNPVVHRAADQAVVASALGGDAVEGEHSANHALPRILRATSCAGAGLRRPSSSSSISGW